MKKLFFITRDFPPEVNGSIRRISAVWRFFSNNKNIDLTVITRKTAIKNKTTKPLEQKNDKVIYIPQLFVKDKNVRGGIRFKKNKRISFKRFDKSFYFWMPLVVLYMIIKKPDSIYCTIPTFTTFIAGYYYKKYFNNKVKLIIEYRDFFSFNPSFIDKKRKRANMKYEKKMLQKTDNIIVTTSSMKKILAEFLDDNKIHLIRNYISRHDYNILQNLPAITFEKSFHHIGYVGTLNGGRDPKNVLNLTKQQIDNKDIILHFVGTNEEETQIIKNYAKNISINLERLVFHGLVTREESLRYIKSFDSLLLILDPDSLISEGYGIPGKLYDYQASSKDIIIDQKGFDNLSSEFDLSIKYRIANFIVFQMKNISFIEDHLQKFTSGILNIKGENI